MVRTLSSPPADVRWYLRHLRCPRCAGAYDVLLGLSNTTGHAFTGLLSCACGKIPIIRGVVSFCASPRVIEAIGDHDSASLTAQLLAEERVPAWLLAGGPTTLFEALDLLAPDSPGFHEWYLHLRYHFATPKYVAALAVVSHVLPTHGRVLDLGTGVGHLAQLILRHTRATDLWAIDRSLAHLLLARWILPPSTMLVQADASRGLPFRAGWFDAVVSADALHCFPDKAMALREVTRVLRPAGTLALTHLHNASNEDEPFQGWSLPLDGWRQLFRECLGSGVSIYDDDVVRSAFVGGRPPFDVAVRRGKTARSFTATLRPVNRPATFLGRQTVASLVNPIYDVERRARSLHLHRFSPSQVFDAEFSVSYPPRSFELVLDRLSDASYLTDLRRRAIIVEAPPRLCRTRTILGTLRVVDETVRRPVVARRP